MDDSIQEMASISGEELKEIFERQEAAKQAAVRFRALLVTGWILLAGLLYIAGQIAGAGSTYRNGINRINELQEQALQEAMKTPQLKQ